MARRSTGIQRVRSLNSDAFFLQILSHPGRDHVVTPIAPVLAFSPR